MEPFFHAIQGIPKDRLIQYIGRVFGRTYLTEDLEGYVGELSASAIEEKGRAEESDEEEEVKIRSKRVLRSRKGKH